MAFFDRISEFSELQWGGLFLLSAFLVCDFLSVMSEDELYELAGAFFDF